MQRNRPPSAQAVSVLRALAADPARWRYGYDLAAEVHLKSGSLYPILVRLADRGLLETSWEPGQGSRCIARLAALSAGLGLYLYGTIAVAVLGAGGPPGDPGSTVSYTVGDRLGNNVTFDLVVIPLVTATIGWAAAAATARLRPRLAASVVPVPFTAAGPAGEASLNPVTTPHQAGPAARIRSWRRTGWLLLLCAGVAAAVFLAVASGLRG